MLTMTAELPRSVIVPYAVRSIHRRSHPPEARRRTRRDVLQMLVGADGGRFAHFPRRRFVR